MSPKPAKSNPYTVSDLERIMESLAPTHLAQAWDNVGLIAGDSTARLERVLLCVDMTKAVVDEAVRKRADLILSYHPPIFKPVSSLRYPAPTTEAQVFECIRRGIAVYATHTALDAAEGGTNDVLAGLCGATATEPLEFADDAGPAQVKVVVFVPQSDLAKVADAMFAAGAGRIGDYSHCSYRIEGHGTFFGSDSTDPTVGRRGRLETVDEIRLESVAPLNALPAVIDAIYASHSYEEPAFDVYPLLKRPVAGIGRCAALPRKSSLGALARRLKRLVHATNVELIGAPQRPVKRIIVVAGAAGSIPFRAVQWPHDVIITGEIRHHDALAIHRMGCAAIALGHWPSERPVLAPLAARLVTQMPRITAMLSEADCAPATGV